MGVAILTMGGVVGATTGVAARDLPALYDEHYRSLVKLASFYVDDVGSAEEVVQDAFVKFMTGRYQVEAGKEAPYLRSMVLNGARSALRKRRVRRNKQLEPPRLVAAAEDIGVERAEWERVLGLVRALPSKQAAVLVLRYYFDLSEREIADTLGIAPGSVKSHAHRGLRNLRDALESQK